MKPGTVTSPVRWSVPHGADITPILATVIAWLPYVVSFFVSRSLLVTQNSKATPVFIVAAIVITLSSVIAYLNLFGLRNPPPPFLVAVAVTLALVLAAVGIFTITRSKLPN